MIGQFLKFCGLVSFTCIKLGIRRYDLCRDKHCLKRSQGAGHSVAHL